MLMMLAALEKIGGRLWSKRQAADAHDAGGFGEHWCHCGVNARQLMLMMLAALEKIGGDCGVKNARQLMLMMLAAWGKLVATVEQMPGS